VQVTSHSHECRSRVIVTSHSHESCAGSLTLPDFDDSGTRGLGVLSLALSSSHADRDSEPRTPAPGEGPSSVTGGRWQP
jgi:hypothetical protein